MKTFAIITATAVLLGSSSGAFAQANPNAPQPNSTGTGVTQPMTSPTGQAIDKQEASGYKGGSTATTGSAAGNSGNSAMGDNRAGSTTGQNKTQSSGGN